MEQVMTVEAESQPRDPAADDAAALSTRVPVAERFAALMRSSGRDVDMSRPVLALARAEERVGRAFDRALEDTGVTAVQFNVLMELAANDGRLPLCDVAQRLLRSPANISALIDRMERDGLVRRVRGVRDRRTVLAEISERGWVALGRAAPAVFDAERRILVGFTGDDRSRLTNLVDRLALEGPD
jgi:MarR family 2-MHQ and catechol resistance regulon transcriptional repressor